MSDSDSDSKHIGHPMSSRQFGIVEKLGKIEAHLSTLSSNYKQINSSVQAIQPDLEDVVESINAIEPIEIPKMAMVKNKLEFHGRQSENINDLLDQLQFLKIANNYTDAKLFGNALLTLKSDALRWYKGETTKDPKKFLTKTTVQGTEKEVGDFSKLEAALKERFVSDVTPTDLFVQLFDDKMRRGETVDAYITRSLAELDKIKIEDSMKVGLLINGMIPVIRDQLKLRSDCTTIKDVQHWARKIEKMFFVKKSEVTPVMSGNFEMNSNDVSPLQPTRPYYQRGPCFICGDSHLKKECPYNFANMNPPVQSQNQDRGQFSNFGGQNASLSFQQQFLDQ